MSISENSFLALVILLPLLQINPLVTAEVLTPTLLVQQGAANAHSVEAKLIARKRIRSGDPIIQEFDVLLAAKDGWNQPDSLNSWVKKESNERIRYPCNWEGILCNAKGRVIGLSLGNMGIKGPIPSAFLSDLLYLNSLNMSFNQLSGTLPNTTLSQSLRAVDFTRNDLRGEIPSAYFSLNRLDLFPGNEELCMPDDNSIGFLNLRRCSEKNEDHVRILKSRSHRRHRKKKHHSLAAIKKNPEQTVMLPIRTNLNPILGAVSVTQDPNVAANPFLSSNSPSFSVETVAIMAGSALVFISVLFLVLLVSTGFAIKNWRENRESGKSQSTPSQLTAGTKSKRSRPALSLDVGKKRHEVSSIPGTSTQIEIEKKPGFLKTPKSVQDLWTTLGTPRRWGSTWAPTPSIRSSGKELHVYSWRELQKATANFSRFLGQDIAKKTCKAVFPGPPSYEGAVKFLGTSTAASAGKQEFLDTIVYLGRLSHPNLLTILGYCVEKYHKLVVFEYIPHGSLRKKISSDFKWSLRVKVIKDIANVLLFLHESEPKVLHGDLKSTNVFINDRFEAKLSEYGLLAFKSESRSLKQKSNPTTLNYVDPEYKSTKVYQEHSDVFSFGVLVFEIVSGRSPEDGLMDYVSLANVGDDWEGRWRIVVDKVLEGLYDIDELRTICNTANQCIKKSPSDRPTMKEVVDTLLRVGNYVEPNTNQLPQPFSPIGELSPYQRSNSSPKVLTSPKSAETALPKRTESERVKRVLALDDSFHV